jgi:hypothetical protein
MKWISRSKFQNTKKYPELSYRTTAGSLNTPSVFRSHLRLHHLVLPDKSVSLVQAKMKGKQNTFSSFLFFVLVTSYFPNFLVFFFAAFFSFLPFPSYFLCFLFFIFFFGWKIDFKIYAYTLSSMCALCISSLYFVICSIIITYTTYTRKYFVTKFDIEFLYICKSIYSCYSTHNACSILCFVISL